MSLKEITHSVAEFAKRTGHSRKTCMEAVRSGQILSVKMNKRHRIPEAEIQRLEAEAAGRTSPSTDGHDAPHNEKTA